MATDANGFDTRVDAHPTAADAALGPRFIQEASAYAANWNNGASSIAVTFSQPVAQGNLIAIYVTYATQGGSYLNTTDAQNDTFMPVDTASDGGQQQAATSVYAANVAGGTVTVTVQFNGSPCCRVVVAHEIAGVSTIDAHSSNHQSSVGTSADAVNAGTITTNHPDYVFAGTSDPSNANSQAITAGSVETLRANSAPTGDNQTMTEDLMQSTSGAVSSKFTFSKSAPALSLQMAFQP